MQNWENMSANGLALACRINDIERQFPKRILHLFTEQLGFDDALIFYAEGEGNVSADGRRYLDKLCIHSTRLPPEHAVWQLRHDHLCGKNDAFLSRIGALSADVLTGCTIRGTGAAEEPEVLRIFGEDGIPPFVLLRLRAEGDVTAAIYLLRQSGEAAQETLSLLTEILPCLQQSFLRALRAERERLETAVARYAMSNAPVGVLLLDQDFRLRHINETGMEYCRLFVMERDMGLCAPAEAARRLSLLLKKSFHDPRWQGSHRFVTGAAEYDCGISSCFVTDAGDQMTVQYIVYISRARLSAGAAAGDMEADLTPREREIAYMLQKGCSNTEIARQLYISLNTVKTHIAAIYRKYNVTSRTALLCRMHSQQSGGLADNA